MTITRRTSTPKEWALAVGGGLAFSAALVWLLRGGDEPVAPLPAPATPQAATAIAVAPPPPAVTAAPDLALAGLRSGPDGGMAIVATGGKQYVLRPGRSLPGGVRLLRIEPGRAILQGPGGEMVLRFADTMPADGPAPGTDDEAMIWRLALGPVAGPSGPVGWRLENLTALPQLTRAGLQQGDVLLSANGAELISEEKIMELPQELASNGQLRLRYRRGSQQREAIITP